MHVVSDRDRSIVEFPPLGPNVTVLLVWPKFPSSYWGMEGMREILPERALMPPLALITIAALLPAGWKIRLIDCAFQELRDSDILQSDLVMLSAMHAQRAGVHSALSLCRHLGRRTIIGGPYASSQPDELLGLADHVVVGEVDEVFPSIAADFEGGRARRLYRVSEKPDVRRTPIPRFDLLQMDKYQAMAVQFSRGCPFQCEFCDIITIYGRRPRTKTPAQMLEELDILYFLGWRKLVFIVDDNFIGNHRAALELSRELTSWQQQRNYPFTFFTEASIDLSQRPELLSAMVEANFLFVFIGIETPFPASLREVKKYQNLRLDTLDQVRIIQQSGLWIAAGFIVGFDADDEGIFDRQLDFIEAAAIPWAMISLLQAPHTTPLRERMRAQGRLIENDATFSFSGALPNFRTAMAPELLLGGTARLLRELYEPERFFNRSLHSLMCWAPRDMQRVQRIPLLYGLRSIFRSFWFQGICSDYRAAYWRFLAQVMHRWWRDPCRLGFAISIMISAHHFRRFALELAQKLEHEKQKVESRSGAVPAAPSAELVDAAKLGS